MFVILNHDKDHPIPITEGTHDYLNRAFHLKNSLPEEQTQEIIDYVVSLRNTIITSIEIEKRNHEPIDSYQNLNGHILNVEKTAFHRGDGLNFLLLTIDIENKQ